MSSQNQRRGVAAGLAVLTAGAATVAFGAVGTVPQADATFMQRDVALVNAADDAHNILLDAQVAQNESFFNQNVVGLQESIYYWVQQPTADGGLGAGDNVNKWLFVDPDSAPNSTNIWNGAFTRWEEAMLVNQAWQQVQWDHLLGVNQSLTAGGYESAIADSLVNNLLGSGIDPTSSLGDAVNHLAETTVQESFSGFSSALVSLQNDLWSAGFSDMLGMFQFAF